MSLGHVWVGSGRTVGVVRKVEGVQKKKKERFGRRVEEVGR